MLKWLKKLLPNYDEPKSEPTAYPRLADWAVQENWEDYPEVNYNIMHTYCSVAFDDSGKTFYYRTRNPNIKVGDLVNVPVGRNYEKTVGKVVAMQDYLGYEAPFPLERTKHILSRVGHEKECFET